jgi:hypothetical protein
MALNPPTYPFIQIHLSNPLNLSIHPYTIYPYTQTPTYPYIGLYIHISIYPYIYHIAGNLKNALNHVLIVGKFEKIFFDFSDLIN